MRPCEDGRIAGSDWEPSVIDGSGWVGTISDGRRRRGAVGGDSSTAGLRIDGTERETGSRAPKDAELGSALLPATALPALRSASERRNSSFFGRSWPPLYKPCGRSRAASSTVEVCSWRRGGWLPGAEAVAAAALVVGVLLGVPMLGTDIDVRNERRPGGRI